ncbi:MAG: hypothetical protein AAFW84_30390 [Cyanobacteria bacterium J06635_15]
MKRKPIDTKTDKTALWRNLREKAQAVIRGGAANELTTGREERETPGNLPDVVMVIDEEF